MLEQYSQPIILQVNLMCCVNFSIEMQSLISSHYDGDCYYCLVLL